MLAAPAGGLGNPPQEQRVSILRLCSRFLGFLALPGVEAGEDLSAALTTACFVRMAQELPQEGWGAGRPSPEPNRTPAPLQISDLSAPYTSSFPYETTNGRGHREMTAGQVKPVAQSSLT